MAGPGQRTAPSPAFVPHFEEPKHMAALNPKIFTWARQTAGLSLEQAAQAIGLKDAFGLTGAERLAALEQGEAELSRPLLVRMAKAYRRSLLVFYLPEPPRTGNRGQDFRMVPGAPPPAFDADLDALLRDIRARQNIVKSLQEDLEAEPVSFIGSVDIATPAAILAGSIAKSIHFELPEFRAQKTSDNAFAYLRRKVEDSGVLEGYLRLKMPY